MEVEDHALIGSKLSKKGVQSTKTLTLDACKDKDRNKT